MEDATTQPDGEGSVPDRFTIDFSGVTLLGIYQVQRKLADGGMGSVYLGEDTNLGRKVVVKVPHVRFLGEAGFRGRFTREITELVRLEHPHIVRILAQGEHDSVPFFVLQYLGGGSLETRLAKTGTAIGIRAALPWFRRIAETLDFVHTRNTVHRDVKPANILFDETGNVYLSDFGVAKALGDQDANLTDAGTGIGSPRYMSPEQGYGRELGPSADQYALAASLYETLSGTPPHGEGSAVELLVRKASEDPEPLASLLEEFPLAASDAIARAMSRDPEERFPDCRSFVDAVERGFGLGTGEVSLPAAQDAKGQRVSMWIAVGLIALAAAFGFWALYDDEGSQAAPAPASSVRLDQTVNLLKAGAEPHRVLRYALGAQSSPFHVHVNQDVTTKIEAGDEPVSLDSKTISDMSIPLETRPAEGGNSTVQWKLDDVQIDIQSQNVFEQRRAAALQEAKGASATFRVHPTGARLSEDGTRETDSIEAVQEESIGQFAHDILIPLPTQPVGPGARWEVVETVEIMRLRFLQTSIYELVSIDGPVLKVKGTVSQAAPSQEIAFPGAPNQKLKTLTGGGETEAEFRLDRVAPIRRVQSLQITMVFEMEAFQVEATGTTLPRRSATIDLKAKVWSGAEKYRGD